MVNIILQRRRTTRKRSFQGPVKAELTEREARELLKVQFSDSCDSQEEIEASNSEQTSDVEKQLMNERVNASVERSLEIQGKSEEARAFTKELENQMAVVAGSECNNVSLKRKNEEVKDEKFVGNTTIKRGKRKRNSSVISPKAADSNEGEQASEKGTFIKQKLVWMLMLFFLAKNH